MDSHLVLPLMEGEYGQSPSTSTENILYPNPSVSQAALRHYGAASSLDRGTHLLLCS